MSLDGFELCQPVNDDDFKRISSEINGQPRKNSWEPPTMHLITEDEGQDLVESDSPWLGSDALIFRPVAVAAMSDLLVRHGELLPLECKGADLMIFNVTTVLDALDEEASTVMRFSTGRIMMIRNYAFLPRVIGDADIFKIPNLRASPTFVSARFVDTWTANDLRGLEFMKVWPVE